jgi:hypothetical protein
MGMGNENIQNGGIIRNNMIYHHAISGTDFGDVGIALENCVDFGVYNNTIIFANNYNNAIEYRFSSTQRITIQNNCTNKRIQARDGASGTVSNNVTDAQSGWFVSPSTGNLHLISRSISAVIDKGISVAGLLSDIDGDKRPIGSDIDIGADEFSGLSQIQRDYKKEVFSPSPEYHKTLFYDHNTDFLSSKAISVNYKPLVIGLNGSILSPSKRLPLLFINKKFN